jgi:hypothetical protein
LYAYVLPKILADNGQRTRDGGKVEGKQKKKGQEQWNTEMGHRDS